jgi:hypothetical protein
LGGLLRYWSFSASLGGNDKKRRKKASGGRRASGTPSRNKVAILEVIHSEQALHKKERERQRREAEELELRYGIASGRGALSEEEMLAYARMVSQETFEIESSGRSEVGSSLSGRSSDTITPEGSVGNSINSMPIDETPEDRDLELALRLSLQDVEVSEMNIAGDDVWEDPSNFFTDEPGPSNASYSVFHRPQSPSRSPSITNSPLKSGQSETNSLSEWPSVGGSPDKGKGKEKVSTNRGWEQREQEFQDDLELALKLSMQE